MTKQPYLETCTPEPRDPHARDRARAVYATLPAELLHKVVADLNVGESAPIYAAGAIHVDSLKHVYVDINTPVVTAGSFHDGKVSRTAEGWVLTVSEDIRFIPSELAAHQTHQIFEPVAQVKVSRRFVQDE